MNVGLELVLLHGLPTHEHSVTKCWSRLDQVFLLEYSSKMLISYNTKPKERGINTNHLPILTELHLKVSIIEEEPIHNFRSINWENFRSKLKKQLTNCPNPACIADQTQLDQSCEKLMKAL